MSITSSGASTDAAAVRVSEKLEEQKRKEIETRFREGKFIDPGRKPCTYCKDYRLGYWVLWDGSMRFCSFLDKPDIPVREMPFREAWGKLLEYEEALDWPEECKSCEAAKVCRRCAAAMRFGCDWWAKQGCKDSEQCNNKPMEGC